MRVQSSMDLVINTSIFFAAVGVTRKPPQASPFPSRATPSGLRPTGTIVQLLVTRIMRQYPKVIGSVMIEFG